MKQAVTESKRHQRRAENPAVAAQAEKQSTHKPVVVSGIGPGELVTVTPAMYKLLDVDPAYQRGETTMVNSIVRALQAGGKVHDPVTLCERKGGDTLWIVDGWQRVCAFQQMKMSFSAIIHKSDSADSEHQFFIAMNSKRAVAANVIVKAWTGPSGTLMRKVNESPEHPLYNRINFSQAASPTRIAASSLARALMNLMGSSRSGRIEVYLSSLDVAMASKVMTRARIEHFLRLLGHVSPAGAIPSMVIRAIATVALERWHHDVTMPNKRVIERLRTKQWATSVMLMEKYFPILLDVVRKMWRE